MATNWKKNRSDKYTTGLCMTIKESKELRFLFFELDKEHLNYYNKVCEFYQIKKLDVLIHRTGSGGYHFLSPTLIQKTEWKKLHGELSQINKSCPMITLRVKPNKYPNEKEIWYRFIHFKFKENIPYNNNNICVYLNHIWKSDFDGLQQDNIVIVNYPLPYV